MNQINVIRNLIKRFFYAPGSMMLARLTTSNSLSGVKIHIFIVGGKKIWYKFQLSSCACRTAQSFNFQLRHQYYAKE